MKLPTLDEFLKGLTDPNRKWWRNSYVRFSGFSSLYVRIANRFVDDRRQITIDLASMQAFRPGKGAFKRLVAHLRIKYPMYTIYVESVLTSRFCDGLDRMGFQKVKPELNPPSFFMSGHLEKNQT